MVLAIAEQIRHSLFPSPPLVHFLANKCSRGGEGKRMTKKCCCAKIPNKLITWRARIRLSKRSCLRNEAPPHRLRHRLCPINIILRHELEVSARRRRLREALQYVGVQKFLASWHHLCWRIPSHYLRIVGRAMRERLLRQPLVHFLAVLRAIGHLRPRAAYVGLPERLRLVRRQEERH